MCRSVALAARIHRVLDGGRGTGGLRHRVGPGGIRYDVTRQLIWEPDRIG